MSKRYRLLFVDDEERVLRSLKSIFRREYDVYVASSGFDALEILSHQSIDVIISDQRMPNMMGNELLAIVQHQYPRVIRLLLTGYIDKEAIMDTINRSEIYRFISKPWDTEEIMKTIAEAAIASRPSESNVVGMTELEDSPPMAKKILDAAVVSSLPAVKVAPSRLPSLANSSNTRVKLKNSVSALKSEQKPAAPKVPAKTAFLLVDKDQRVRNYIRIFSRHFGITVYTVPSNIQAVRVLALRPHIGVVVMGISGDSQATMDLLKTFKRERPDVSVIALADETDANMAVRLINEGQVFRYLQKPISAKEFDGAMVVAMARHKMLMKATALKDRYREKGSADSSSTGIQKLKGLFQKTA